MTVWDRLARILGIGPRMHFFRVPGNRGPEGGSGGPKRPGTFVHFFFSTLEHPLFPLAPMLFWGGLEFPRTQSYAQNSTGEWLYAQIQVPESSPI